MGVGSSASEAVCGTCHSSVCALDQEMCHAHHQVVTDLLLKDLFSDPIMDRGMARKDSTSSVDFTGLKPHHLKSLGLDEEVAEEPRLQVHRRVPSLPSMGDESDREDWRSCDPEGSTVAGERAALSCVSVDDVGSTKLWPKPVVQAPSVNSRSRRFSEGELRFPGVGVELHPAMPGMSSAELPVRLNPAFRQLAEAQGLIHDI